MLRGRAVVSCAAGKEMELSVRMGRTAKCPAALGSRDAADTCVRVHGCERCPGQGLAEKWLCGPRSETLLPGRMLAADPSGPQGCREPASLGGVGARPRGANGSGVILWWMRVTCAHTRAGVPLSHEKEGALTQATTWMNPEDRLSEGRQPHLCDPVCKECPAEAAP